MEGAEAAGRELGPEEGDVMDHIPGDAEGEYSRGEAREEAAAAVRGRLRWGMSSGEGALEAGFWPGWRPHLP